MANALTTIRLLLVIPYAVLVARSDARSGLLALLVFAIAVATDALDGPMARRRGEVSAFGGTYDHASDFLFVSAGLAGGAWRGAFPWLLPMVVAVAFAQYTIDSYLVQRQGKLRGSWLGRWNGILYFAPPVAECIIRLWLGFLRPALTVFVWALILSTLVSMGQRLAFREKVAGGAAEK